jgi:hypothetical protein
MTKQPEQCPACGEREGVRIVWGLPVPDELDRTDVTFGGCTLPPDPPTTRCRACGHDWGRRPVLH